MRNKDLLQKALEHDVIEHLRTFGTPQAFNIELQLIPVSKTSRSRYFRADRQACTGAGSCPAAELLSQGASRRAGPAYEFARRGAESVTQLVGHSRSGRLFILTYLSHFQGKPAGELVTAV